jgi:hypothetical protein
MSETLPFHTSSDEDEPVYHDQSECGYGKEIIRDGNMVAGVLQGSTLCTECARLASDG